jgi:hypothetical protein
MIKTTIRSRLRAPIAIWLVALFYFASPGATQSSTFGAARQLTDSSENFQLSRNPSKAARFDGAGTLHLTYWSGSVLGASATLPSFVYYQAWTESTGWTPAAFIDDSTDGSSNHLGGRHPALAILPDDTVFVTWNDARDTQSGAPFNNIDNLEIYADRRAPGGSFSATDERLTQTTAPHIGDNGYLARPAVLDDGRMVVVWYDFNQDASVSDVYLLGSDAMGDFTPASDLIQHRVTSLVDRSPSPVAYTVPDVATDSTGAIHVVWTENSGGAAPVLYATTDTSPTLMTGEVVAPSGGGFFDPPRIAVAPNDDVWVGWVNPTTSPDEFVLRSKASGALTFGAEVRPLTTTADVSHVDVHVDSAGRLHLVWVDERAGTHVYYGLFDPVADQLLQETQVSPTDANWERPTLALDAVDQPYIFMENNSESSAGDIWFVPAATESAASGWEDYR